LTGKSDEMNLIEMRDEVLKLGDVCDHCLGRQVSLKFRGHPCEQIGTALRAAKKDTDVEENLKKKLKSYESKGCVLCRGVFLDIPDWVKKIKKEAKKYEFNTFVAGSKINVRFLEQEEMLWTKIGARWCEPLKRELNRTVGEAFAKTSKKKADLETPDVMFIINLESGKVEAELKQLFIYGRYRKLKRGLPQTKWPCRECRGSGCKECGGTGKQYPETVEELIAEKILKKTKGRGTKFHGSGREDKDARMLGEGRPFVIEIVEPVKRNLDFKKLEKSINRFAKGKVEVLGLRLSDKKEVRYIKTIRYEKTYEALVGCEDKVTKKDLKKIEAYFQDREVSQETPKRVLHRRADKIRKRKVFSAKCEPVSDNEFRAVIKTEAGTYVKELISGDDGRTKPSFTGLLGKPYVCKELDVIEIHELNI
jgi:tRNA pseudouridine synthase 10